MRARTLCWAALVLSTVAGCEKLIGADFDGLKPLATGGAAGQGGGSGEGGGAGDVALGGSAGMGPDTGGSAGTGGTAGDARDASSDRSDDGSDARPEVETEASPPDDAPVYDPDALVGTLVINEMEGVGNDWIELYNAGAETIVLDGFGVAQASGVSGPPDLGNALVFPSGTSLNPGGYVLVVGKQLTTGPSTSCFNLAPSCYSVLWGISSSNGEGMYILLPGGTPLSLVLYPPPNNDGGAPVSGQTWGRVPNGTGDFMITVPTANADNHQ